jgi:hypothetical protein
MSGPKDIGPMRPAAFSKRRIPLNHLPDRFVIAKYHETPGISDHPIGPACFSRGKHMPGPWLGIHLFGQVLNAPPLLAEPAPMR